MAALTAPGSCCLAVAALLAVAGATLAGGGGEEPTPAPTPTPSATAPPPTPGWRPPPVPTRRGRPPEKEVRLGADAAPGPTPPALGSLASIKKGTAGPVTISDDTLGTVLPPVTPTTAEEYATMVMALLTDWSAHEAAARKLIDQAKGRRSVTEEESWTQRLNDTAAALAQASASLAAIVPPTELRAVHSDMVSTLRTFDRAVAVLSKEPTSAVALEAADELVLEAGQRAVALYERMQALAREARSGG